MFVYRYGILCSCAGDGGIFRRSELAYCSAAAPPLQVPLMNIKSCTEKFLEASGLDYTTFRLCGFHQVGSGVHWVCMGTAYGICAVT